MNGEHQPDTTSKRSRREVNELFGRVEKVVKGYEGSCLFAKDGDESCCNEPVSNNCHIVSEKAVLKGLEDAKTQKILELQWGISQWRQLAFKSDMPQLVQDPTTFEPSPTTTHDACVGWFACKQPYDHDGEFQLIDAADPDFNDPIVRFLAAYRLVLFFTDQCRLASKLQEKWHQTAMRITTGRARALWLGQKERLNQALGNLKSTAALLGKNWYARKATGAFNPDLVSAQVVRFRSRLSLAGGVFYGRHTVVTVFPTQDNWHRMGILHLTSDSDRASADIKRLAEVASTAEESVDYGVTVTNELMTNGWGTLAVSPQSYERLDDQDRDTITGLIARHVQDAGLVNPTTRQRYVAKRRRR